MYQAILKYIGQLKTAEQRLIVTVLLCAVISLFGMLVSNQNSSSREDKRKIIQLEFQKDSIQRALQSKVDQAEDDRFNQELERRIELQKYVHYQDSLLDQLRRIK